MVAAGLAFALLQRRRFAALVLAGALALPVGIFMTLQEGYLDRLQTIRTYDDANDLRPARRDGAEESALGRLHFWRVAIDMARARPLGVGLFGFEPLTISMTRSTANSAAGGRVHSSHLQALTEAGVIGAAAYIGLFAAALRAAFRIRRRGRQQNLSQDDQVLFGTCGNALIVSMTAFLVGGSFVWMALNRSDVVHICFSGIIGSDLGPRLRTDGAAARQVREGRNDNTPAGRHMASGAKARAMNRPPTVNGSPVCSDSYPPARRRGRRVLQVVL